MAAACLHACRCWIVNHLKTKETHGIFPDSINHIRRCRSSSRGHSRKIPFRQKHPKTSRRGRPAGPDDPVGPQNERQNNKKRKATGGKGEVETAEGQTRQGDPPAQPENGGSRKPGPAEGT